MNIPLAISDAAAIGSAFGAAVLGAVVGGFLTSRATRTLEQDRREHQDQRDPTLSLGPGGNVNHRLADREVL